MQLLGLSLAEGRRGLPPSCANFALSGSRECCAAWGLGGAPQTSRDEAAGRVKCRLAFLYLCSAHSLSIFFSLSSQFLDETL